MLNELRHACRSLIKTPGFTLVAVLTLAVGIGATTSMFSALRALVVDPFSYPQADRLVMVWSNDGQPLSAPDFFDLQDQQTSFSAFGAYSPQLVNLGTDTAQAVVSVACTPGVLQAFGIAPLQGRWLEPADEEKNAPAVAIISHALWQSAFGGNPAVLNHTIRLNGGEVTVVGIMPPAFEFSAPWMVTQEAQVWTPLKLERGKGDRGSHWMCGLARLKDGVSLATADAEIKTIGARLKADYPNTNTNKPFLVRSLRYDMTRNLSSQVWMLFGAVALVLLVACANVASMLLARGARRQSEFGVRIALGASRGQILRLNLIESLAISLAGAVLGLILAAYGVEVLGWLAPISAARRAAITLSPEVVLFATGATMLTTLLAGLPSAFTATRISVADQMRSDSRSATGSRARHHLLRGLVVAQIAVAFLLVNGAALFSASYVKLLAANDNLATEQVLSAKINLRGERYPDKKTRARLYDQLAERVRSLPGVTAVGLTSKLPLEGGSNMYYMVNDEKFDPAVKRPLAEISSITPGYFEAAGIRLLRGRTLDASDAGDDNIGIVVNRTFAETSWPGEDPLGKIVRPGSATAWFHGRVVGVVESVRQWGPASDPKPEIYWTMDRSWSDAAFLLVHSARSASQLAPLIRRELKALDPDVPLASVRTLGAVVHEATEGPRALVGLVDFFMALALGLVAVGLYGTLSYHVLQRTREIGVRLAMGAEGRNILALVLRQGLAWVSIGVIVGMAGSLASASILRALIWRIDPISPAALLAGTAIVFCAAALACWWPARRAANVNPIEALRSD